MLLLYYAVNELCVSQMRILYFPSKYGCDDVVCFLLRRDREKPILFFLNCLCKIKMLKTIMKKTVYAIVLYLMQTTLLRNNNAVMTMTVYV